ncbi:MAG: serine hydrolase domain-containing protein [Bacteroidota bacterium]
MLQKLFSIQIKPQVVVTVLMLITTCLPAQVLEKRLETLVDSVYNANKDALGILIHVESPDKHLSWTKAVGFSEKSKKQSLQPMQPVLIASNTKTYVAAAILRLVEDQLLQLNAPIRTLLNTNTRTLLENDGYDLTKITVKQLLSHTSGIHDYVDDAYFDLVIKRPQYRWTKQEQIQRSVTIGKPLAKPGTAFHYGDINYLLLTEIIETVTQKDFYAAMRMLLRYDKLELKHTWFKGLESTPKDLPEFAHQYAKDYTWDSSQINDSWDKFGGGGMATTVKDAALFYQYLFEGKIIRDKKLLKEMYTYVLPENVSKYCLGIFHFDIGFRLYYHGGWWGTGVNHSPDTNTSIAVCTLVKEKRDRINPFLGKKIHEIISKID